MTPPWFADTFFFLALLDKGDAAHSSANAVIDDVHRDIVTTPWVLTELADGLCAPRFRSVFAELLDQIRADDHIVVVRAEQGPFDRGVALYLDRPDKAWSLTDCISFVVMEERGITEALTGDHHFEQAGFTALLA